MQQLRSRSAKRSGIVAHEKKPEAGWTSGWAMSPEQKVSGEKKRNKHLWDTLKPKKFHKSETICILNAPKTQ
jgi:hypothetical protein